MTGTVVLGLSDDFDRIPMLASIHIDPHFTGCAGVDGLIGSHQAPRPTEVAKTNRNGANESPWL